MNKGAKDKEIFSVRMPSELRKSLEQLAEADKRSLSNIVIKILSEHVEAHKPRRKKKEP